jgi:hypothetical protein
MNQLLTEHLAHLRQADLRAEADRDRLIRMAKAGGEDDLTVTRTRRLLDAIRDRFSGLRPTYTARTGTA